MTISRRRSHKPHRYPNDWVPVFLMFAAIITLAVLVLKLPIATQARGHDLHAQFHFAYQNWMNGLKQGCCNNLDCHPIKDDDERTIKGELHVRVKGQWCPVLQHHYLTQGNAPDASVSHICVTGHYGGKTPCEQFICYQPKPGT